MKAPKKIYLQENTTTDCYEEFYPEWFEARARKSDIEYIRTDAFINKACEWLKKSTILADTTIERFKKAMEEQQ